MLNMRYFAPTDEPIPSTSSAFPSFPSVSSSSTLNMSETSGSSRVVLEDDFQLENSENLHFEETPPKPEEPEQVVPEIPLMNTDNDEQIIENSDILKQFEIRPHEDVGETVPTDEENVEIKRVPLGDGSFLQVKNTSAKDAKHIPYKIGKISWEDVRSEDMNIFSDKEIDSLIPSHPNKPPKSILKQPISFQPESLGSFSKPPLSLSKPPSPDTAKAFFAKIEVYKYCEKHNISSTDRDSFLQHLNNDELSTVGLVLEASKKEKLKKSKSAINNALLLTQSIASYIPFLGEEGGRELLHHTMEFIEMLDSANASPLQLMQDHDLSTLSDAASVKLSTSEIISSLLYRLGADLVPVLLNSVASHLSFPSSKRKGTSDNNVACNAKRRKK